MKAKLNQTQKLLSLLLGRFCHFRAVYFSKRTNKAGHPFRRFTLIELIAVTIILSIITVGSIAFFTDTLMMGVKMRERESAMQKAQIAVDRIRKELLAPFVSPTTPSGGGNEITLHGGVGRPGAITFNATDKVIAIDGVTLLDNVYVKNTFADRPEGGPSAGLVEVNFTVDVDNSGTETDSDMDFNFVVSPRN